MLCHIALRVPKGKSVFDSSFGTVFFFVSGILINPLGQMGQYFLNVYVKHMSRGTYTHYALSCIYLGLHHSKITSKKVLASLLWGMRL